MGTVPPCRQENHLLHQTGMIGSYDSRNTISEPMTYNYRRSTRKGLDNCSDIGG